MPKSAEISSVGFAPIARRDARILILGSLPGRRSLETAQYYAHPRNAFWPIMKALYGASGEYRQRCRTLMEAGVAVWDVLLQAVRPGSLDTSIQLDDAQTNDFEDFFREHRRISLIAFNGRTAEALFRKHVEPRLGMALPERLRLPSTSPAHASLSIDQKQAIWRSMLPRS